MIITSVTTCMNRVKSIKNTLLFNIEQSKNYKNVKFLLVNYGSKDDLEDYVKNNLLKYIESGKFTYVKVLDQIEFFHMSRAKNIAVRSSNSELIFNCDAEWKSFEPFYHLVFKEFVTGEEKKILRIGTKGGAFVTYRKHIDMVGGYDESMIGWGFEDADFLNRLRFGLGFEYKENQAGDNMGFSVYNMHGRRDNSNVPTNLLTNNLRIHRHNMRCKKYIVNEENKWGRAKVLINFKEEKDL